MVFDADRGVKSGSVGKTEGRDVWIIVGWETGLFVETTGGEEVGGTLRTGKLVGNISVVLLFCGGWGVRGREDFAFQTKKKTTAIDIKSKRDIQKPQLGWPFFLDGRIERTVEI